LVYMYTERERDCAAERRCVYVCERERETEWECESRERRKRRRRVHSGILVGEMAGERRGRESE
jgi:hypothetical protein